MVVIISIIHVLVCVAIILIILLQSGKGADLGAAFGGSSQTIFGSGGAATFLSKMTTIVAVVFMLTSLGLALMSAPKAEKSIMQTTPPPVSQEEQAAPQSEQPVQPINPEDKAAPQPEPTQAQPAPAPESQGGTSAPAGQ
ncbi:MAG: preprotein translocase subunit SecG [Deltaproteobacteria bacterium]|nr:preprotein translocase subunit SecG [Deltaproteobacteria bacterium]